MSDRTLVARRDFLLRTAACGVALAARPHLATAAEEPRWQIGCYTRPWDNVDYRAALDAIAEAGFKYAGLMTTNTKTKLVISVNTSLEEAAAIGAEVKKRGLRVPSVYGGGIPCDKTAEVAIKALRGLIDACAAAGAKSLLMGGVGNPKQYEIYYQAIGECSVYAEEKGLGLALKPHGGLNATGPQLRDTIRKVGKKNFTAWYDAGNIFYYSKGQLNPIDDAPSVAGLVTGWCIKDYLPAKPATSPGGKETPAQVMLTPGSGKVDFRAVFARLKQGGFTGGPLVVECLSRETAGSLVDEARKARQFLEALVAS